MGGQTTGNIEDLQLTQSERPDPATQRRQEHLFRQAEQYAGQSPFQQQYGYGSSMVPGLSGMSQTGQQYLTDRILGKGAYRVQDLGFSGYRRPDTATPGGYQYGQSGYQAGDYFGDPSATSVGGNLSQRQATLYDQTLADPSAWYNYMYAQDPSFAPEIGGTTYDYDTWNALSPDQRSDVFAQGRMPEGAIGADPWLNQVQWQSYFGGPGTGTPGTGTTGTWTPGTGTVTGTGGVGLGPQPGPKPGQPGYVRPGRDRSDWSPWMGETYEEGAPSGMAGVNQPGYELNIWDTPDIPFGAQNLPTATSGDIYRGREGTGGGLLQTDLNRPTSGVGIGEVEDARTATRRMLMEGPRAGDPGYNQFLDGGWQGLSKASGVGDLLPDHYDAEGRYHAAGWHGLAPAGTGTAPGDPGISVLGSQGITDPSAIGDEAISGISEQDIADVESEAYGTGDAVSASEVTRAADAPRYTDPTIDPLYAGWTPEELGTAETSAITDATRLGAGGQDVFTGSSFLGGPAGFTPQTVTETDAEGNVTTRQTTPIEAYMDAGGVGAQVTAAQLDYARAQNEEQARRAQSLAWGTRGDIPRAEQETAMLARIAEIRRKGYTDAADRMEADLQRQQAAGMQTQQLGTQGALQAQQLEAQRVGDRAARAQQAALAQQQLGAEAGMQTQRLGVGADQRQAELDLQAALANQQAALQSGSQDQQLEAQRAIRQAELDLQASHAQAGVETDVALQQQQLEQQAGIRGAELEAQRQQRETELRLQRGMQTQQLGADAAAQQTQNEFARRQALATMGQDAATQQTQNEFARRQALAEMGLRAQGMGMDDQARFREQQMALAQQLGRQGLDEQAATFAAAQQLAQMGMTQEQRQQMQAAADYEQWLRSQEGFADEAAFLQAMQPQAGMAQYQRKPSTWGQIAGGLLAGAGTAAQMGAFGSDARIKDNIEYVGMENGFKTYEFNYLGRDNRYKGVMAQEVMVERPDAVEMQDGFYRVNYDAIGVQFEAV